MRSRALGFAATAASVAAVAAGITLARDAAPRADAGRPTSEETLVERLRRVTQITCSPSRRSEALRYGSNPFCAPFDSIPAVNHPNFVAANEASLPAAEPVVGLDLRGSERAYPIRFLIFHEVVNDLVSGEAVVVTYCPLCNSAAGYVRRAGGRTLTFGVSGQLDYANLVMFDRETLSRWGQLTGKAISGKLDGRRLEPLPVQLVSFAEWKAAHPSGLVMKEPAGGHFLYGEDPYSTYDADPSKQSAFLHDQRSDPRLPPKWRVVGVARDAGAVAFAYPRAGRSPAVRRARLGREPLVAFFRFGTAQTGKRNLLRAAPRGFAGSVWSARLGARTLRFAVRKGRFVEVTTGSAFDFFGRAVSGSLAGRQLAMVPQVTAFWFAWSHFHAGTEVVD